jgi:short-subunit dehydrogenase
MQKPVVLITGASSGLGKAIGTFLTSKNYKVYGTSRNPSKLKDFDTFELVQLDVNDVTSIQKAVSTILAKEASIDILINNAGIGITGPIEDTPEIEIKKAFDTNFYGPLRVANAVLPQMRKQNKGLIINVTSIAGYMGLPYRGFYSAVKAALIVLTEALSSEVKQFGITVADVAPGDFKSNIAAGRYHTPVFENSAYKTQYSQVLKQIDEEVDTGMDVQVMVDAVYKVIKSKKPKLHYKAGAFMQKFSIVLKFLLPDRMYEKLILNHYKL